MKQWLSDLALRLVVPALVGVLLVALVMLGVGLGLLDGEQLHDALHRGGLQHDPQP